MVGTESQVIARIYMCCNTKHELKNAISEIYNKIQTRKGSYRDVRCLSAIGVASEGLKTPLPPRFPSSLRAMRNLDIVHAMYCAEILRKPYRSHAAPACSVFMASPLSESMRPTSSWHRNQAQTSSHLLRLIVLSLAREGVSQIVRGCPRVGMLGS